ncbi:MAG: ribosomal RNA small subunit methyltransferase A [Anaerolineales bacterium]|nr:ribosomal RNA small subunit methyltransferase A [Anaerolineales bacterium]
MAPLSELLHKYNLRPRKGLGQNFLTDPHHLAQIVAAAELSAADTVLEVGPGPGTLTRLLAEQAGRVIAVELDPAMVHLLQSEYGHYPNLTILHADILTTPITPQLLAPPTSHPTDQPAIHQPTSPLANRPTNPPATYKVVANLPYYITSAVVRHLLESDPQPERLVITVQKEVAQRIVAEPGDMSLLAVSVQFYGRPKLVHSIPAGAFYPSPKVDSAVVRIDTYAQPPAASVTDIEFFFQVVKAGFSQKRKQLKNTLAAGLRRPTEAVIQALEQAGIDPARRAQTLSVEEWGKLTEVLQKPLIRPHS